ncbi:hypothetical protein [Ilumatobacter sp.]|uniref:hypothetical protein n=1 Tax=Ilumatobacter sp. TaxID=1967498 RepID=UPI003C46754D
MDPTRRTRAWIPFALVGALFIAACGSPDILVVAERADQIPAAASPDDLTPAVPPPTVPAGPTDPTVSTDPAAPTDPNATLEPIDPAGPMGEPDDPVVDPAVIDRDAINFGAEKPPRPYDEFLLAALTDIDTWLRSEFEPAFGFPFQPLEGQIYAGYPERTDPLPGCGEPVTSYVDLQQFVAFYCPLGDFMVYDDGPDGLLAQLAGEFGAATIGIVLAHEYGHAIQSRTGVFDLELPTVASEQQADCVAGAWAGRAAGGNAPGVPFSDDDIRAGLVSMIAVQDPVGTDPNEPGGHGSGFDRVGAYQVGFRDGLERCALLIDDPLPLTPLFFLGDQSTEGNAPFGFGEDELFGFLVPDLNLLYGNDWQERFPDFRPLTLEAVQSVDQVDCANPFGLFELGVELCSSTNTVYLNEPVALQRYNDFGDFAPGYLLGVVWAEHALISGSSDLRGEPRQLRNDCLVGAWVKSVIPVLDENGRPVFDDDGFVVLPQPRDEGRQSLVSPNDLTEAIRMAIIIGDPTSSTDVLGSAFEKIDAFRQGILGGVDSCT